MAVEKQLGPTAELFPESSPEDNALAKVEPILGRPVIYHTLRPNLGDFDFSAFLQTTRSILKQGLKCGKDTGASNDESVHFEIGRHHERFCPKAKPIQTLADFYEAVLDGLAYFYEHSSSENGSPLLMARALPYIGRLYACLQARPTSDTNMLEINCIHTDGNGYAFGEVVEETA